VQHQIFVAFACYPAAITLLCLQHTLGVIFQWDSDLQPDGLNAELSGHCQPEKNIHSFRKKKK